ncbi:glyoxylate/hydroxypyruvate reductase B-like isoform X1 [Branchiostoma floridae]|uniref:Glyoxylate reductase/hydroxypyruvate reductase n=2 Tax=Branchiostoma floridae TaxID=7739 RepID=A0A9J7KJB0_BRAFL|nr:glyoxylate/hydroxypyruvate reductase B-like isoform X1 [Branchiostoma floridae]
MGLEKLLTCPSIRAGEKYRASQEMASLEDKPMVLTSHVDELNAYPQIFVPVIKKYFRIVWWADFENDQERYANEIQGILVNGGLPKITSELLDTLPNLKIVSTLGVGTDHLDLQLLKSRGIKVSSVPDVSSDCVADWGMTLLVAAARKLPEAMKSATDTATPFNYNILGKKITGSTLGIVGLGRIGYRIAERALGFKMRVLYNDITRRPEKEAALSLEYYSSLDKLLPNSDFIITVVPLTPQTHGMMGREQFKLMKKSAIFINIARAPVVQQDELVEALQSRTIQAAVLDVTSPEPLPPHHPLLHMPNVIITPHMGANSLESRRGVVEAGCESCTAAIQGKAIPREVVL